jgi:hypothetical protein
MNRLLISAAIVGATVAVAAAQPATFPALGETLPVTGSPTWGNREWLYDKPSMKDAAGKVVLHWFCSPKGATCIEDLARVVSLRESGRVYVVAHIAGTKAQALKLDPIRESEGVGKGTLAFGRQVTKLMKELGIDGPASVVVDHEGKVALVSTGSAPADLDARDEKVKELASKIRAYVATSSDSPKDVKAGDKFTLSMTVELASWLSYSTSAPMQFELTAPPDWTCDAKQLGAEQMTIEGGKLTAKVTCSGPKGIYEARGALRFGYETPSRATGLGSEGARWKFEIKP